MIHEPEYMKALLRKYMEGAASAAELRELMMGWDIYDDEELSDMMAEIDGDLKERDIEYRLQPACNKAGSEALPGRKKWLYWLTGVLILLCLLLWVLQPGDAEKTVNVLHCEERKGKPLPTTGSNCILKLGDGRLLHINGSDSGLIAKEEHIEMLQAGEGLLAYHVAPKRYWYVSKALYHSIITPKDKQYRLKLADGSMIRLNAGSTLDLQAGLYRIPEMTLKGEALLEVAGDEMLVYTSNATLRLTRGRYNVKATILDITYATVLEGEMEVIGSSHRKTVEEGWQAFLFCNSVNQREMLKDYRVDIANVVSWTWGVVDYNKKPTWEFVTEMAKRYGLDIEGFKNIPADKFITVKICAEMPVEELMNIWELNGLLFIREGRTIKFLKG